MLTIHMSAHIAAMNVVAPMLGWLIHRRAPLSGGRNAVLRPLILATTLQLGLFFIWHSPPAMTVSMDSAGLRLLMLVTLLGAATWFWACVYKAVARNRMEVIAALLLTGKLVCLIAVLLVFAPRLIYPGMVVHAVSLDDQQMAGLLMLSACPLTYVGASIYIVARWFNRLAATAPETGRFT
jgi:putative membrane protein